jgi:hypothetical protein
MHEKQMRKSTQGRSSMSPFHIRLFAVVATVTLATMACGGASTKQSGRKGSTSAQGARVTDIDDFSPSRFGNSALVSNNWFPLRPGTEFVYVGKVNQDNKRVSHRVVFTVTDLTKEIDGVRTIVLYDRDYTAGELVEAELTFHAQDKSGNVWNLGEYPEEYEDGNFEGAPDTWIAGVKDARGGVIMQAHPRVGTPSYSQGLVPSIEFSDRAKVQKLGAKTCVPTGCYQDVLVTNEWDPHEPGAHQLKYYAPGVGNVRVGFAGAKEKEKETLVLGRLRHLGPSAMANIRHQVFATERRAYRVRKDIYGQTPPAKPMA